MDKHFLDLQVGDKVICVDEYSGGTSYHTLVIDFFEDDEEYATETNPLGRRFWEQTKIILTKMENLNMEIMNILQS